MVSEPTMFSSTSLASGGIGTAPGCHAGVAGSTFRLCSGAAYFNACAGALHMPQIAATLAARARTRLINGLLKVPVDVQAVLKDSGQIRTGASMQSEPHLKVHSCVTSALRQTVL